MREREQREGGGGGGRERGEEMERWLVNTVGMPNRKVEPLILQTA